jgi:NADH:ubiquinone oxidoreductase subunit B-like Fe-S oxidoreductase
MPSRTEALKLNKPMAEPLRLVYEAMSAPKWVVAIGDCAVDGGCFAGSYAVLGGAHHVVPVDLAIPGCPPRPIDLIAGLLALLEQAAAPSSRNSGKMHED